MLMSWSTLHRYLLLQSPHYSLIGMFNDQLVQVDSDTQMFVIILAHLQICKLILFICEPILLSNQRGKGKKESRQLWVDCDCITSWVVLPLVAFHTCYDVYTCYDMYWHCWLTRPRLINSTWPVLFIVWLCIIFLPGVLVFCSVAVI